jgi:hypothetical protein
MVEIIVMAYGRRRSKISFVGAEKWKPKRKIISTRTRHKMTTTFFSRVYHLSFGPNYSTRVIIKEGVPRCPPRLADSYTATQTV